MGHVAQPDEYQTKITEKRSVWTARPLDLMLHRDLPVLKGKLRRGWGRGWGNSFVKELRPVCS